MLPSSDAWNRHHYQHTIQLPLLMLRISSLSYPYDHGILPRSSVRCVSIEKHKKTQRLSSNNRQREQDYNIKSARYEPRDPSEHIDFSKSTYSDIRMEHDICTVASDEFMSTLVDWDAIEADARLVHDTINEAPFEILNFESEDDRAQFQVEMNRLLALFELRNLRTRFQGLVNKREVGQAVSSPYIDLVAVLCFWVHNSTAYFKFATCFAMLYSKLTVCPVVALI
ncbi:hypothetical protein PV04_10329 [Phialophora macrospora]|uniref:Uncharacterized protein n=1 Tax=Phialophora macrospora TaxID=1851006 RepID=A0A0D2F9B4_9EURO|nr:hypothetical protein PV04_10329 [Phialophora macrospora]